MFIAVESRPEVKGQVGGGIITPPHPLSRENSSSQPERKISAANNSVVFIGAV